MSLMQFVLILSSFMIIVSSVDAYQRRKLNFLHFLIFLGGGFIIVVSIWHPEILDIFGRYFGLTRGADLVVYISIILLGFFYFELLNSITRSNYKLSKFITIDAINRFINHGDMDRCIEKIKNMRSDKSKYLFLVRCYNEANTIGKVIDDIYGYGFDKILVVNDGSWDLSMKILNEKVSQYNDKILIILSHTINMGGGAANKTGFRFIKRHGDLLDIEYVVTFDADGQMDIKDMDKFMLELKVESVKVKVDYDILLGSRFVLGGGTENMPFIRKIILLGSKIITLMFNKIWVSDPHNGYRVISFNSFKKMKIYSDGMLYASELIDEIKRLGLKFKEIPVNIIYTEYSLKKGQKNSNALKILLGLIYKKFFYK